jgi:hypothetical protein
VTGNLDGSSVGLPYGIYRSHNLHGSQLKMRICHFCAMCVNVFLGESILDNFQR